jgi:tRNA(adenine34) deaminase
MVVYGASDYKTGAAGSVFNLLRNEKLNHQIEVTAGVLAEQSATKISNFFKRRRQEKKALKKKQSAIIPAIQSSLLK